MLGYLNDELLELFGEANQEIKSYFAPRSVVFIVAESAALAVPGRHSGRGKMQTCPYNP